MTSQDEWRPLEKTFAMIKPDAVRAGHVSAILKAAEDAGFVVVTSKETVLSPSLAGEFYQEHKGKEFFGGLVEFMASGPIVCLCLAKTDAIKDWRALMGPTNTQSAKETAPFSLRARFGTVGTQNATHGSDSPQSATRELKFHFPNLTLDPTPTNADAKEYIRANLTPTLIKGFAALCKEKPSAQKLEAVSYLAQWLRDNNPKSANEFTETELAIDRANEDANDFEMVQSSPTPLDTADVSEALDDLEEEMNAAVTVQSHFRGHQARKNAQRERKEALGGGGAQVVVLESHTDADKEHAAAAKLQATYRGHASRKETKKMKENKEEAAAATKLQSGFRGFQARKEVEEMKAEKAELTQAATKVQAGFRGHQDRKKIAAMKGEGVEETEKTE